MVFSAIDFAAHAHTGQFRCDKAKSPFVNHLLSVLNILSNEGNVVNSSILTASVLHDYLEDCCGKKNQISIKEGCDRLFKNFGPTVTELVMEVTDEPGLTKEKRREKQIMKIPHLSYGAKIIKLGDKLSNLRDILINPPNWSEEACKQYIIFSTKVVEQINGNNIVLESKLKNVITDLNKIYNITNQHLAEEIKEKKQIQL